MKTLTSPLVATLFLAAAALPACNNDSDVDQPVDFVSEGKPDLISIPVGCAYTTASWAELGTYPQETLAIGDEVYAVDDVLNDATSSPRAQVIGDIAAVLLNLENDALLGDDILVAVGVMEEWLISDTFADAPEIQSYVFSDYFDSITPCTVQGGDVVVDEGSIAQSIARPADGLGDQVKFDGAQLATDSGIGLVNPTTSIGSSR